jgi:hypothetical protein
VLEQLADHRAPGFAAPPGDDYTRHLAGTLTPRPAARSGTRAGIHSGP